MTRKKSQYHCVEKKNFCHFRFYVKSLFDDFKVSKTAILTILETLDVDFGKFLHFLRAEIYQNQKSRASKTAKMTDFELLYSPNLISRKI